MLPIGLDNDVGPQAISQFRDVHSRQCEGAAIAEQDAKLVFHAEKKRAFAAMRADFRQPFAQTAVSRQYAQTRIGAREPDVAIGE